ncbi:MAG TPA: multidrug effflux MFS transporter [Pseudolabrys sp.]|nr:multidrug effflux MFS transporter [Pseudolabrys sp.]
MLRPGTFALTALLALLTGIGPFSVDMYLPSLPDIEHGLGATAAQVQLTISSYLVGFAVGGILYGPVSDRYGRKPVLLAAMTLFGLASIACLLSTSIEMLIVARALQSLGGCGAVVIARAVVRDLYSGAQAGRELSRIGAVMALAPVVAPLLGGVLQTAFGWRANFVVLVLFALVALGAVSFLLPETLRKQPDEPFSLAAMARSYGVVGRSAYFLAHMGLSALSFAGLFAWISVSAFVLQNLYGLPPALFAIAFAIGSGGYLVGTWIAAKMVTRLGLARMLGVGSLTQAVGGIAMVLGLALGLHWLFALVLPMAIYLAGMGMVLPQSAAGALTPFPQRAGAASSLLGLVQQSTAAICGAIVGALLGHSAWPMVAGVALAGGATLILWIASRGVRAKPVPER